MTNPIVGPGGQPQNRYSAFVLSSNPNGSGAANQLDVSGNTSMVVTGAGLGSSYEALLPLTGSSLFISNSLSDNVTVVDVLLGSPPITVGLLPGSHPVGLATTQTSNLYVANSGTNSACPTSGSLSVINNATLVTTNTICTGVSPVFIAQAPSGGPVYVLNGDSTISVYLPGSTSLNKTLAQADGVGLNPVYALASLDGTYMFVVAEGDGVNPGMLNVINVTTNTVVGSVPLGVSPTFAAINPNFNRLFVTNKGDNTVMVFDSSNVNPSNSPIVPFLGKATVGTAPVSVAILPNGTKFYTANSGSNNVTVLSGTSFQPLSTVPVGTNPVYVASEPSSTKVYVANNGSSSTSIIQTLNDTVATTLNAPQQDPLCVPTTTVPCALQQPLMVLTK